MASGRVGSARSLNWLKLSGRGPSTERRLRAPLGVRAVTPVGVPWLSSPCGVSSDSSCAQARPGAFALLELLHKKPKTTPPGNDNPVPCKEP